MQYVKGVVQLFRQGTSWRPHTVLHIIVKSGVVRRLFVQLSFDIDEV
jgi:hypothetical protein